MDVPQFISLYRQEVNIEFLLFLLQILQIFHQRMHTDRRIVDPGSFMELFDTAGICNGVIQPA
jgi:hypothetical protein